MFSYNLQEVATRPAPLFYMRKKMFYVYVLQNTESKEKYIGSTNDIERRIEEHNNGFVESTHRKSGEWKLIYCEQYLSEEDARLREKRLKSHGRAKQELFKRIINSTLK